VSVELFTGYYPNNGLNTSVNYGTKKWKWNFNGGIRNQQPQGRGKSNQENFNVIDNDSLYQSISNRERKRNQTVYNVGGGFTYDINPKQTFNYGLSFRYSDRNDKNNVNYTDFKRNQTLLRDYDRNEDNDNTDKNFDSNLGYTYKITENQKLTFDGTFNKSIEDASSNIHEEYTVATINDKNKVDQVANYQDLTSFMLKSDYELKLKEDEKIEAGGRFDSRNIINNFEVDREGTLLDDYSGNTEYHEKVSALYLTYSNKYKSISYNAGLRYENSEISVSSTQKNQRENIAKNYDNFFPTASISYELKENHQLQFSYSKRISRPSARFLLRLFNFSDDRNIFQGNPDLNPSITDSYEINYAYQTKKLTLNPGIYFKHIKDQTDFAIYSTQSDNLVTTSRPFNLDYQNQYGVQLIYSYSPVRFWRTFGEFNFFRFDQKGSFSYLDSNNEQRTFPINADSFSWNFRLNTSLRLKDIIDFQINTNYTGRMQNQINDRKPMWIANSGVSKDVLKGNGTIGLNVQDIFNSFKRHIITQSNDFYRDFEMQFRLRQVNLSFTYRFNQKKKERDASFERKRDETMEF
jgi:outer membrane receptor protein involved in Fe transport